MKLKSQHYQVAFRARQFVDDNLPLENKGADFKAIKNDRKFWLADPFLFDYKEETFLFCEMYSFKLRRGVIGFSKFQNGNFSKFKPIIIEPFHMSYPLVFEHNGFIYMLPETCQAKELRLYRAVKFPYQWELDKILKKQCSLVDTTIFSNLNNNGFLGYTLSTTEKQSYYISLDNQLNLVDFKPINEDYEISRGGGNIFEHNDRLFRVCQDCKKYYGRNLIFKCLNKNGLQLENVYEADERNVRVLNSNGKCINKFGMHTYNFSSKLEVIDIKLKEKIHFNELLFRFLFKLRRNDR